MNLPYCATLCQVRSLVGLSQVLDTMLTKPKDRVKQILRCHGLMGLKLLETTPLMKSKLWHQPGFTFMASEFRFNVDDRWTFLFGQVINYLLRGWLKNVESEGSVNLPFLEDSSFEEHGVSRELEFVRTGSKKSVSVRLFSSQISLWSQLSSFLKRHASNIRVVSRWFVRSSLDSRSFNCILYSLFFM